MATTITQAKLLLTAAELELFDHSRAEPIKAFTAKQLAGREKRARTLRDKYRDLYRRQTVAQRGKAAAGTGGAKASSASAAAGETNARTQRKGDILQEVLERFEARSALLELRSQREAESKSGKSGKSIAAKGASPKAGKADAAVKKAPATLKAAPGKKAAPPEAKAAAKPTSTRANAAASSGSAAKPARAIARSSANAAAGSRKPKQTEVPLSAVNHLQNRADSAVQVDHLTGLDPTERSHKAPSDMAPTHGGKAQAPEVNAPLDMVPAASRGNPVRNLPGNIAIQGHISSSVRHAQGKKDSR